MLDLGMHFPIEADSYLIEEHCKLHSFVYRLYADAFEVPDNFNKPLLEFENDFYKE